MYQLNVAGFGGHIVCSVQILEGEKGYGALANKFKKISREWRLSTGSVSLIRLTLKPDFSRMGERNRFF